MKICAAQVKPAKGNITPNITKHITFINLAVAEKAEIIVSPELSLTGYEPSLARILAIHHEDERLSVFDEISHSRGITVAAGIPLRHTIGITISMILFQPGKTKQVYSKKFIHQDEEPFFVAGENYKGVVHGQNDIALAICYEISVLSMLKMHINGDQKSILPVLLNLPMVLRQRQKIFRGSPRNMA